MDIDELIMKRFNIQNGHSAPFKCDGCTRVLLAKFLGEVGYKVGAEVGVEKGLYSKTLCKSISGLKLKCIDPYLPYRRHTQDWQDRYYRWACGRLKEFDAEIIRKPSMEAVKEIPNKSLDFVYLDQLHEFDFVMADLICWSAKVRRRGMIAGRSYVPPIRYNGVKPAVDSYTESHKITKWYLTDEPDPSFFWVKND